MLTSSKTSTTIFCAFSLFLVFFNPSYGNEVLNTETITDKIGAWIKVCNEDPEECAWVQLALNSEGKQVARFVIKKPSPIDNKIDSIVDIMVPFTTGIVNLRNGIALQVDRSEPFSEQFTFCDQTGCTARVLLTVSGTRLLSSAATLKIQYNDLSKENSVEYLYVSLVDLSKVLLTFSKN